MADSLATIRSRVAVKAGNVTNRDSLITENINEAILQVIQEAKPQEMWAENSFTTSNATAAYLFSGMSTPVTDVLWVLFVRSTTGDYPLHHRSFEVWNRYKQSTSTTGSTGDPHLWTRLKNGLVLFGRIPDSTSRTIHFDYLKRPTRLSADGDSFPLNDEWKRPVEELAAALTLADLNSPKADVKFATYQELLARRMTPENEEEGSPEGSAFIPIHNLNMTR